VFMLSETQISEAQAENLWQIIAKEQGDTALEISNKELGKILKLTLLSAQKDNEFLLEIFDAELADVKESEEEAIKYYSEAEIKEINKTSITPYLPEGTKVTNVRYNDEGEEFLVTEFEYGDALGVMSLRKIDTAQFKSEKSKWAKESKVMKVNDVDFYCYGNDSIDTVVWHSNGLMGEIFFRTYVNIEEFIPKFFASYK